MLDLSLAHEALHLYMKGLHGWLSDRTILVQSGFVVDTVKRLSVAGGGGVVPVHDPPLQVG